MKLMSWLISVINSCLRKEINHRYKHLRILGCCVWWRGGDIMIIDSNWAIILILWRKISCLLLFMSRRRISGPTSMLREKETIILWWFGINKEEINFSILERSALEIIQREYIKPTRYATQLDSHTNLTKHS